MAKNILVSVAWPYANGEPHLGHVAGVNIPADIFARYHRSIGNNVAMVSGSDMHGTPTALRALDEGVEPKVVAERYHKIWAESLETLGISYDLYTHTHTDNHIKTVQKIFLKLYEQGYIYETVQSLPFSEKEQIFLPDRLVEGTCPFCGHTAARGDQCDNCNKTLDPIDLLNIRSLRDGSTPVFKETKHLFLKLTAFKEPLREWCAAQKGWRPNVTNHTLSMIDSLRDRSITRDLRWGVPVPLESYKDKCIYVWFEAVLGYLSATIEWAEKQSVDWRAFWQGDNNESYYFMGKDNIAFHSVILPAILMGYGGLNLPTEIVANEFLNLGGKLSKSRGNALWLKECLEKYQPDMIRYYLASIMPEFSDSEFSWQGFTDAINNELVATFGNLVNRVLTIAHRNFDGRVPKLNRSLETLDQETLKSCEQALSDCASAIGAKTLGAGLRIAMALAKEGNRYIASKAPWVSVKDDIDGAAVTIYVGLRIIETLKVVLYPYIPHTTQRLHSMLGFKGVMSSQGWQVRELKEGDALGNIEILFNKLNPIEQG